MIGHYLASALANFRKTPFTTAANVLTLALGLACFIAALGIAAYWTSADRQHPDVARTFVVGQGLKPEGGQATSVGAVSTGAAAKYLAADFPQIERVVRAVPEPKTGVSADGKKALLDAAYVEPGFLDLFKLDFVAGDSRRALSQPNSVILTEEAAGRLFGDAPALGRQVLIGGKTAATVTGVISPVRQPSFMGQRADDTLRFDMLGGWAMSATAANIDAREEWFSNQALTFIHLKPGASTAQLNAQLPAFVERRMPDEQKKLMNLQLQAFPVGQITTRNLDNTLFVSNGLKLTVVAVLVALGLLILLVAGVNYANLATAQAALTAKEVGMRRVMGAGRVQVMIQSWLGSLLQALAAAVVALMILATAAPPVRTSMGVDILFALADGPAGVLLILAVVVAVALAAGAYPALVMSGVRPIQGLSAGRSKSGPRFVARVLVAIQFAPASFLLILLSVSLMQRHYMQNVGLTDQKDQIVILNEIDQLGAAAPALIDALRATPGVKSATVANRMPWTPAGSFLPMVRSPDAGAQEHTAITSHVGQDYFSTVGFKVLAGRVFDRAHETATHSLIPINPGVDVPVVIDAAFARDLGFASPQAAVDQTIYAPLSLTRLMGSDSPQPMRIIGVIETDATWIGANPSAGAAYLYGPDAPFGNDPAPILRLSPQNLQQTMAAVTRVWDQFAPDTPADIRFFDQMFESTYWQYDRLNRLFTLLASVAFVIASMGLLGIAVHVAARRRREIAVRKTLGSTTWEAVRLLLTDFSKPVIIANLIAWPLGYLAAQTYLSSFAHHIDLTVWPFALSMLITLGIAWLAVGGQTYRAASVRPAQVLRDA